PSVSMTGRPVIPRSRMMAISSRNPVAGVTVTTWLVIRSLTAVFIPALLVGPATTPSDHGPGRPPPALPRHPQRPPRHAAGPGEAGRRHDFSPVPRPRFPRER